MPGRARQTWLLVTAASWLWLLGDTVQRVLTARGYPEDVPGPADVFWLGSYPLLVAGIVVMILGRGLPVGLRRELWLDTTAVTVAAGLGAWQLLVAPGMTGEGVSLAGVLAVLYPLGDVAVFAMGIALLSGPRTAGTAGDPAHHPHHDSLTGLANRAHLVEHLRRRSGGGSEAGRRELALSTSTPTVSSASTTSSVTPPATRCSAWPSAWPRSCRLPFGHPSCATGTRSRSAPASASTPPGSRPSPGEWPADHVERWLRTADAAMYSAKQSGGGVHLVAAA